MHKSSLIPILVSEKNQKMTYQIYKKIRNKTI